MSDEEDEILKIHNMKLRLAMRGLEPILVANKEAMNRLSVDINTTEKLLRDMNLAKDFIYTVPNMQLSWSRALNGTYRLLWSYGEKQKPLAECNFGIRQQAMEHLPELIKIIIHALGSES